VGVLLAKPQLHHVASISSYAALSHPSPLIRCLCICLPQQTILRYVPDEGIINRLTQRWDAGGQGIVPGGSSSRRSSNAAAGRDSSSLSVRRWEELVQEVNAEVSCCYQSFGVHTVWLGLRAGVEAQ
jgi:hypothetical protein